MGCAPKAGLVGGVRPLRPCNGGGWFQGDGASSTGRTSSSRTSQGSACQDRLFQDYSGGCTTQLFVYIEFVFRKKCPE